MTLQFIYKFSQISGHENVQPSAVRFILVGENAYGANLQSDKGYISWIDNRKKYSLNARAASEYLDFQVNVGLKIQYMIFDYTPLPEEPEEPELGPNEEVAEPSETKKSEKGDDGKNYDHYIYNLGEKGLPCAVRFTVSGTDAWGANLRSDQGYIKWIDNNEKSYLNPGDAEQYLEFVVNAGITIEEMVFDYSPVPELKEREQYGKADGKKYYYEDVKRHETDIPDGVRCFFSGAETITVMASDEQRKGRAAASSWVIGQIRSGETLKFDNVETGTHIYFEAGEGVVIQFVIFHYPEKTEEPEEPEIPVPGENEALATADENGVYSFAAVNGYENRKPIGMRFRTSGGNEYGAGLQIDCDPYYIWYNFSNDTDITVMFQDISYDNGTLGDLNFSEITIADKEVAYMIFIYGEDQTEEPEKPTVTVGENEALAEAREGTKYYFADVEGREGQIPVGIRFKGSGSNENGSNLVFDNWSASGWVNFNSQAEVIQLFKDVEALKDETPTEFIELQDATLEYLVFIYDDASTASMFSRIAARALRSNMNTAVLLDETGELLAVPDEEENYYLPDLPEDNPLTPIGIRADVASNTQDVTLIFSEDQEESAILADKKAYYFFKDDEADRFESVSFTGQEVKNVTFLYWNGEKGEAAEKEGEYALPDYRIPAAISYYGAAEEDGKAEVKLMVQVYDKEAGTWKAEGKELVKRLAVDSEGVNWYIFTKSNRETLEDAFKKAKAGGVAPRLQFVSEEGECSVEELTLYYDTPYTDDMEITGPKEEMDTGNTSDTPAESAEPVKNETKDSADNDTPAEETQAPADQNTADDDKGADPVKPSEDEKDTGAVPEDKEDTGTAKEDEGQTESSKPSGTEGEKKDDAEAADPAKPSEDQEGTGTATEDQEDTGVSKKDQEDTGTATEDKKDTGAAKAEADPAESSKPSGTADGKKNEESSSSRTEMTANQQSSGIAENSSAADSEATE